MHQRAGLATADGVGDLGAAQRGGQAEITAGQRLADAHDVGADAGVVGGEQLTGAPETGGDLIEDQQHTVAVAGLAQIRQVARVVEAHPTGALDHRLDDYRRQFIAVTLQLRLERGGVGRVVVAGHQGANSCVAKTSRHSECMPPSGSQMLIGANVSPW